MYHKARTKYKYVSETEEEVIQEISELLNQFLYHTTNRILPRLTPLTKRMCPLRNHFGLVPWYMGHGLAHHREVPEQRDSS